jgi:putative ABC transport system permease protein
VNSQRVAIINETMARTYWPNEDPLGKRITIVGPGPNNPWATVIGVVRDVHTRAVDSKPGPDWYLSYLQTYRQRPIRNMTLFVRTAIDPVSFGSTLRQGVSAADRDQPLAEITTLSQVIAGTTAPRRFNTLLLSILAGIALLLAAFGIYSVISYSVERRAQEIGVRMALGAQSSAVMLMVIKQGMAAVLLGLTAGLIAAAALTKFMTTLLYEVSGTDPLTFGLIAALLVMVALLACYIPARRATKVDPMITLKYE